MFTWNILYFTFCPLPLVLGPMEQILVLCSDLSLQTLTDMEEGHFQLCV